ncbi:MAG: hypothetical protein ACX930_13035 [Erythrobacter sp.]
MAKMAEVMGKLKARLRYRLLRSPAAPLIKQARKASMGPVLARRARLSAKLPCDTAIVEHAAQLEREGYVRLDSLIEGEALRALAYSAEAKRLSGGETAAPQGVSNKAFWSRLLDEDLLDGRMPVDTAFTRFALQPRLLGMLAETLGTLPLLDYVLLTLSGPRSGELTQSQLWHRDHDDLRVIKLFVYLTDVESAADGPFSFLPGPVSDRVGSPRRSHSPDIWLFSRADRSEVNQMIAPRLSAFAVETSRCLHMGSRVAQGHERLLFTATYTTAPRIFGSGDTFVPVDRSDELVHAVLGQDLA